MKTFRDLSAAALRLRDASQEADSSFMAVLESDGEQLTRDLEHLAQSHPSEESLRVCQSARALLSSMQLLHRGAYFGVTAAAGSLIGDVVEYALAKEPGITEAEKLATEAGLQKMRDSMAQAVAQLDS